MADEKKETKKGILEGLNKDYLERLAKISASGKMSGVQWIGLIVDLTPCKKLEEAFHSEDLTYQQKHKLASICKELNISEIDWIKKLIDTNCPNIPAVKS